MAGRSQSVIPRGGKKEYLIDSIETWAPNLDLSLSAL